MSCNSMSALLSFLQSTRPGTSFFPMDPGSILFLGQHSTHRGSLLKPSLDPVGRQDCPSFSYSLKGHPKDQDYASFFRSNKHIYAQVIDDSKMHTLASASTMQKPISEEFDYTSGPTVDIAKRVGEMIAKSCIEKGITKVAFDQGTMVE